MKAAGLSVMAAVMEGPTSVALLPLVNGLLDLLESLLICQPNSLVGPDPAFLKFENKDIFYLNSK
jgi:hypothetical protein